VQHNRRAGSEHTNVPLFLFGPDPKLLTALKTLLESGHDSWKVFTSSSLEDARAQLMEQSAEVLIVDGRDGLDAPVSQLRNAGATVGNPRWVIALLDASSDEARDQALRLKVNDLVSHPPHIELLRAKVEHGVRHQQLRRQLKTLQARMAMGEMNDAVTGLPNRKRGEAFIRGELERVARGLQGLGVALYNLDFFGVVNSAFGNPMGDRVLADIANAMKGGSRTYDMLARWDGKVFVAAYPDTTLLGADTACRRHIEAIRGLDWSADGETFEMTASVGLAYVPAGSQVTLETLLDWAKAAMKTARESGRDQVVHAPENEAYSDASRAAASWDRDESDPSRRGK